MRLKIRSQFKICFLCGVGLVLLAIPGLTATKSATTVKPPSSAKTVARTTATATATPVVAKWQVEPGPQANIRVLSPAKQLFMLDTGLNLAALENGKIEIYGNDELGTWNKVQTLEVPEVVFTTFLVKDLNDDQVPELIAGTNEPGFIYVYSLDANGQWVSTNNGKYIWSAIAKLTTAKFSEAQSATTAKSTAAIKSPAAQTVKVSGGKNPYVIVQNKEGFIFVLKISETALDLTWKSPAAWKPIDTVKAMDLDNDTNDELVVVYKNGGLAILKIVKNAVVSTWEYFPWGKVLSLNYCDWDNNGSSELNLTTTQKMIYQVKYKNKQYSATQQGFDYVIEKMFLTKLQNQKVLLTSDTSGKVHLLEWSQKTKKWKESQVFQTGRILECLEQPSGEILLINQGLQTFKLKSVTQI